MRKAAALLIAMSMFAPVPGANAKEDLGDLLNALNAEDDAKARIELIKRLAATKSDRAADALSKNARRDGDATVRIASAVALASMDDGVAFTPLKELLIAGGIREVRRQAAIGMSKMKDGLGWTTRRIAADEVTERERLLLISALADFPSLDAAAAIEPLAASADVNVRCTALRALARHPAGRPELGRVALDLLRKRDDAETQIAVLDACDGVCDEELRGALPGLVESKDGRIAAAAALIAKRLAAADALAKRKQEAADNEKRVKEGYAPLPPTTPDPVPVPPLRPKVDVVFVYDATASMLLGHIHRVPGELIDAAGADEGRPGTSFRHAFVAMQDTRREASDPYSKYFTPVFDAGPLRDQKWRLESKGVDTEGIEVGRVLREVLDRFEWRRDAARRIVVFCDNYIGDPDVAERTAAVHHGADGFELEINLVAKLSDRRRAAWEALAEAAGTVLRQK